MPLARMLAENRRDSLYRDDDYDELKESMQRRPGTGETSVNLPPAGMTAQQSPYYIPVDKDTYVKWMLDQQRAAAAERQPEAEPLCSKPQETSIPQKLPLLGNFTSHQVQEEVQCKPRDADEEIVVPKKPPAESKIKPKGKMNVATFLFAFQT